MADILNIWNEEKKKYIPVPAIAVGGGSDSDKPMKLLADITITERTSYFEFTNLNDFTEFFFIFDDVTNETSTTDSALNIVIGNYVSVYDRPNLVCSPPINKKSGSVCHGWATIKFNGRFWIPYFMTGNTIDNAFQQTAMYAAIDVNESELCSQPAKALTIQGNSGYLPISGRIRVWGR